MKNYLFSSESVTEGHPDKLCDQISDAILDAVIKDDPAGRVCCETVVKTGMVLVTGEISTSTYVDIPRVVRKVLRDVGYTDAAYGISADGCAVINTISEQSGDISQGVTVGEGLHEEQGAGDQGIMFGYATNETPEYMPLPIVLAHKLCKKLAEVRKDGTLPWVRPDGKSQVTIKYINNKPICTTAIVIAAQHNPGVDHATIKSSIIEHVIKPVCGDYLNETTKFYVNETGRFVIGGPEADAGVTGRKIIVDTYGGVGAHGGGCFSGKVPNKPDRYGAYVARYIAKNIVAAEIADRCEIQLAYAIGVSEPLSVYVNTFGTGKLPEEKIVELIRKYFKLTPAGVIEMLDLWRPIYQKTAAYGHFGRDDPDFTWERLDKVSVLKEAAQS